MSNLQFNRIRSASAALAAILSLVVLSNPRGASAHACSGSAIGGYYYWDCDDDGTLIVFGRLYLNGTARGMGICLYNPSTNSYITKYEDTDDTRGEYEVFAGGGDDYVRLALGEQSCGSDGGTWTIKPELWSLNVIYGFNGEAGVDYLYLCGADDPVWYECLDNEQRTLYGGDGNDYLYGSVYADSISGDANSDHIWGYASEDGLYGGSGVDYIDGGGEADYISGGTEGDVLWGNDGADWIYGGAGCDYIAGMDHDDHIYGEAGCDHIWGGGGTDTCSCGIVPNDGVHEGGCEGTAVNCGVCSCS